MVSAPPALSCPVLLHSEFLDALHLRCPPPHRGTPEGQVLAGLREAHRAAAPLRALLRLPSWPFSAPLAQPHQDPWV